MRNLLAGAVIALVLAVGCSQGDAAPVTGVHGPFTPTAENISATDDFVPRTPTSPQTPAVDATEQPVAPASARQISPLGRGFVPLDEPTFLFAHETDYFGDEELVLGIDFAGEIRAYPVRMIRYHHIVNDMVGGEPLLVTY